MINRDLLSKLDFKRPSTWLALWFGCGLMRPGPGTWGTIGGLPFGVLLLVFGGLYTLIPALVILLPIGWWACDKFEQITGEHDAGAVVIDEVAGIWITLLFAVPTGISVVLAFVLFRIFDVLKPWPVSYFDRMKGANGVMADDLVAGLLAGLCLAGLRYAGIG